MKNGVVVRFVVGLALIAGVSGTANRVMAQKGALVSIPFAFEINHQALPAGEYKIHVLTPRLISFSDRATGTYKALVLVHPQQEREVETRGRMIFLRGDRQNFLSQIRFEGSNLHANLVVQDSLQRELSKHAMPTDEIAMK